MRSRLAAWALALAAASASANAPVASVNTNKVDVHGTVQLTVRVFQAPGAAPDFRPLERDFDVLSRGQAISHQWISGARRYENVWTLSLSPKRSGTLTIPPIKVAGQRTRPIEVHVSGGQTPTALDDNPVRMDVLVDSQDVYVQAQALVTVRIRTRVQLYNAGLKTPTLDDAVLVVAANRQFLSEEGGVKHLNFERVFAIFPQSSGTMEVPSLVFTANVPQQLRLGGSLLGPGRAVRLVSPAITLNVKPRPVESAGAAWLPARSLRIHESWEPASGQLAVGVPLTRRLRLVAEGALGSQLPPFAAALRADGVKAYPSAPQTRDDLGVGGVRGRREEAIDLVSVDGNSVRLPAIRIPWWNTETDREEILELPARTIGVVQGPKSAAGESAGEPAPASATGANALERSVGPWSVRLFAAASAIVLTMAAWAWRRDAFGWRRPGSAAAAERDAWRRLQRACRAGKLAEIRRALLAWQPLSWPAGAGAQATAALEHILALLDRRLYGGGARAAEEWPAEAVLESLSGLRRSALSQRARSRRGPERLPALYEAG